MRLAAASQAAAVLAALVGTRISTTVTPMTVGYLLYSALALAAALWARPKSHEQTVKRNL